MTLFSIQCTTCKTRLRVRDQAAIGQILPCPKCGSMVMVEPPAGTTAAAVPPAALPDARVDAVGPAADNAGAELAATVAPPSLSAAASGDEAPADTPLDPPAELAGPALPPDPGANWSSPAAARWRQYVVYGVAAAGGMALAVGLIGLMVRRSSREVAERDSPARVERATDDRDADQPSAAGDPPAEPAAAAVPGPLADSPSTTLTREAEAPSQAPPPPTDDRVANPLVERTVSGNAPAGFLPRAEEVGSSPQNRHPVADSLLAVDETFTTAEGDLTASRSAPAPTPRPQVDPPQPSETPPLISRPVSPPVADVAAGLAFTIPQIELTGTPLADLLRLLADVTAAPITLDADALRWLRLDPATPVRLRQSDVSVATLLTSVLEPMGLQYFEMPGHLLVTAPELHGDALYRQTYDLTDLVDQGQQPGAIERLVMQLVQPESWRSGGETSLSWQDARLTVRQTGWAHYQLADLLEKLRAARRAAPAASRWDQAQPALAREVKLNFGFGARLGRILNEIGRIAGVTIVVDWKAIGPLGWAPPSEGTLTIDQGTVADALSQLLEPMGLTYRVVDRSLWQVTTPQMVDAQLELELYPLGEAADGGQADQLIQRAQAQLGPQRFREGGGRWVLAFDPDSRRLAALMSQSGQIALGRLLEQRPHGG